MPAQFRFGLQPLLDWRERVEAQQRHDFATCRRAADASERRLGQLADARRRWTNAIPTLARAAGALHLPLCEEYLRAIDAALARERRSRVELAGACERAREAVIAASRERRVIERLRERRRRAFEMEAARREELELDESNARGHERAMRERRAWRQTGSARP